MAKPSTRNRLATSSNGRARASNVGAVQAGRRKSLLAVAAFRQRQARGQR